MNLLQVRKSGRQVDKMAKLLKLPVGIDSFEKIRKEAFYYVDKTKLIEQLLAQWGRGQSVYTAPADLEKH